MTAPARQPYYSTIMSSEYTRTLAVQLQVMYGDRTMFDFVKYIPHMGIYQPLPEDDEVGQQKLQHLLATRDASLLSEQSERQTEQGNTMLAALRARLPRSPGAILRSVRL
jgi:hypothetical protein